MSCYINLGLCYAATVPQKTHSVRRIPLTQLTREAATARGSEANNPHPRPGPRLTGWPTHALLIGASQRSPTSMRPSHLPGSNCHIPTHVLKKDLDPTTTPLGIGGASSSSRHGDKGRTPSRSRRHGCKSRTKTTPGMSEKLPV